MDRTQSTQTLFNKETQNVITTVQSIQSYETNRVSAHEVHQREIKITEP